MKDRFCFCEDCGAHRRPLYFRRVPAPRFYGLAQIPMLGRLLCAECAALYIKPTPIFDQVPP